MSLPSLANLPATLLPAAERAGTALRSAVAALDAAALARLEAWPEERLEDFRRVAAASDFVAEQAVRDPAMLLELAERGELENPHAPGELRSQLQARLEDCADEDELGRRLRRFRTRQQLRIIWRDLTRRAEDEHQRAEASLEAAGEQPREMIGQSAAHKALLEEIRLVANSDLSVLI
ncbi:hypothetical protein ABTF04_18040, partial [Acinetobacter baumannii]